jgi:hypothetical protein
MPSTKSNNRVTTQVDKKRSQVKFCADGPLPTILFFASVLIVIAVVLLTKGHLW